MATAMNAPAPVENDRIFTCDFCGKKAEGHGKYIYPVPSMGAKLDNRQGKEACSDCYPEIYQQQVEQGLVAPAHTEGLDLHSWKEKE